MCHLRTHRRNARAAVEPRRGRHNLVSQYKDFDFKNLAKQLPRLLVSHRLNRHSVHRHKLVRNIKMAVRRAPGLNLRHNVPVVVKRAKSEPPALRCVRSRHRHLDTLWTNDGRSDTPNAVTPRRDPGCELWVHRADAPAADTTTPSNAFNCDCYLSHGRDETDHFTVRHTSNALAIHAQHHVADFELAHSEPPVRDLGHNMLAVCSGAKTKSKAGLLVGPGDCSLNFPRLSGRNHDRTNDVVACLEFMCHLRTHRRNARAAVEPRRGRHNLVSQYKDFDFKNLAKQLPRLLVSHRLNRHSVHRHKLVRNIKMAVRRAPGLNLRHNVPVVVKRAKSEPPALRCVRSRHRHLDTLWTNDGRSDTPNAVTPRRDPGCELWVHRADAPAADTTTPSNAFNCDCYLSHGRDETDHFTVRHTSNALAIHAQHHVADFELAHSEPPVRDLGHNVQAICSGAKTETKASLHVGAGNNYLVWIFLSNRENDANSVRAISELYLWSRFSDASTLTKALAR